MPNDVLNRSRYLVAERASPLRPEFGFDIVDAADGTLLLEGREAPLGRLIRVLRFSSCRRTTPFDLRIHDTHGALVVRLVRGIPVTASRVRVYDGDEVLLGTLRQRAFSLGGAFDVLDATGAPVCRLVGRLTRTAFTLLTPERVELAHIRKRWAGLGKELFTSADHFEVEIPDLVPPDRLLRQLILAAAVAIGLIVKIEIP